MSKKEHYEMLPAEMPKWIRDHVELYLSDTRKPTCGTQLSVADPVPCRRFS
jgi:hypothetical protein